MNCRLINNYQSEQNQLKLTIDSPMQIRLINFLGLKSYLMDKLIFRRKQSTYRIRKENNKNKLFIPREYKPPLRYQMQVCIIEYQNHSIPITRLTPITKNNNSSLQTIVYAHGNSSDMADGLKFIQRLTLKYEAQYVVFDYNGYGQSRNEEVGEQIICKDMEIVLSWINKPLDRIILWGFSLGSYPVLHAAAKYHIKGVILQCPIASVACFFKQNLNPELKFREDYFSNIQLIQKVKGKIFLIHSSGDEIIPISHAKHLFDKYVHANGIDNIYFIEIMKLSHNGVHKYLISHKQNDLQIQLLNFLKDLKNYSYQIQSKQQKDNEKQTQIQQNQKNDKKNNTKNLKSLSKIDQRLIQIKNNIRLAEIQQQIFYQDAYQIVTDQFENKDKKRMPIKINCFCFPDNQDYQQNRRQKFNKN